MLSSTPALPSLNGQTSADSGRRNPDRHVRCPQYAIDEQVSNMAGSLWSRATDPPATMPNHFDQLKEQNGLALTNNTHYFSGPSITSSRRHDDTSTGRRPNNSTHDVDHAAEALDAAMRAIDGAIQRSTRRPQLCPYHLQLVGHVGRLFTNLDPKDRFMAHHASEQASIYHGFQQGTLSTTKPCTCWQLVLGSAGSLEERETTMNDGESREFP